PRQLTPRPASVLGPEVVGPISPRPPGPDDRVQGRRAIPGDHGQAATDVGASVDFPSEPPDDDRLGPGLPAIGGADHGHVARALAAVQDRHGAGGSGRDDVPAALARLVVERLVLRPRRAAVRGTGVAETLRAAPRVEPDEVEGPRGIRRNVDETVP